VIKHFPSVAEMSNKTEMREITGKMDEFLFYLNLVAIVRTVVINRNSFVSTVISSPVFVFVSSWSYLSCVDGLRDTATFYLELTVI